MNEAARRTSREWRCWSNEVADVARLEGGGQPRPLFRRDLRPAGGHSSASWSPSSRRSRSTPASGCRTSLRASGDANTPAPPSGSPWRRSATRTARASGSIARSGPRWTCRSVSGFPPLPPRFVHLAPCAAALLLRGGGALPQLRGDGARLGLPLPGAHAKAHSLADSGSWRTPPTSAATRRPRYRDGFDKIYEVCWLNVFGPKLVETVGRERMLSTPAHRVEELPNGSILLVTWPTAADFASEEARQAQARAHAHLRPDLDFDTVLRTLRERSATLAPVEPRFHPDVAPLLSRVVDDVAINERQRKIAELNAYQPPEPDEWLPADAALPSDVTDPKARAGALLAAGRVPRGAAALRGALRLRRRPPSPSRTSTSSSGIENFPRTLRAPAHRRARGARRGRLPGRGAGAPPGRAVDPAQEAGGGPGARGPRVWLPFVRARRYMRSRQSLLDSSLTQLYRVAERYRS